MQQMAWDSSPVVSVLNVSRFGKQNPTRRALFFERVRYNRPNSSRRALRGHGRPAALRHEEEGGNKCANRRPTGKCRPASIAVCGTISTIQRSRNYDAGLVGVALPDVDRRFVEEHCPHPGWLLDLGCGTGRLLTPLAQRGYRVLGVDLSEEMLTVVRSKVGAAIPLLRANITELNGIRDQTFDYAVCLFSTLGMVMGAENRRRMVAHVFRLLRPGGCFILHVHNRWFNVWNAAGRAWLLHNGWRRGDRVMPAHQGVAGLTLHLFTRGEASRLLTEAGFRVREIRSVSLRTDGRLPLPWWFGGLRATAI